MMVITHTGITCFVSNLSSKSNPIRGVGVIFNWLRECHQLEEGEYQKTSPIIIPPRSRVTLRPGAYVGLNPAGLLLSEYEYNGMCENFRPAIHIEDELRHAIYDVTAGHAGASSDLFQLISRELVRCYCLPITSLSIDCSEDIPSSATISKALLALRL